MQREFKNLGNHGQVLILFVILLPVLVLGIFGATVHFSTIYEKRKLTHIAKITCEYALEEPNGDEIRSMVAKNDTEIENVLIKRKNQSVNITLKKEISVLFLNQKLSVKTSYECTKLEGKI